MLRKEDFYGYEKYILQSGDLELEASTLGATVTGLWFKGRQTVLGYDSAEAYLKGSAYICAAIGRYANRIGRARFELDGRDYALLANEGQNQLHGGPDSFDKRRWTAESGENSLRFTLLSPDGDNGFPGNLTAAVTYTLRDNTLRVDFEGESDMDTVFAPTSHMYFNLDGSKNILNSELMINSSRYLEVDSELIPTGRLIPAEGDFDFKTLRPVGRDYDHCFLLDGEQACTMRAGGITMSLKTDFPAVQIYTASALGAPFGAHRGLAIEPEFYPDSPNRPEFPSTVLRKGEKFHKYAEFYFSVQ